jgi:hypothetical protein
VQFILYTEKTVSQALAALHERMQAKGTSSRPGIEGWVEKNGGFSLGVTTPVIGRFTRTTHMRGKLERQTGITVVKGGVSHGATRENLIVIYIALLITAFALMSLGNVWLGVIVLPVGAALYIPLSGDQHNSELLMDELQRALKAKATPPKPAATTKKTGEARSAAAKPLRPASMSAASKPATASRPAARPAPKPAPKAEA